MGCATGKSSGVASVKHVGGWAQNSVFHQRFELQDKLGKGSFATVYSVSASRGESADAKLVAKLIDLRVKKRDEAGVSQPISPTVIDEAALELVRNEMLLLRIVQDVQYCVRVYDSFIEAGFAYLVMERCDMDLYRMLRQNSDLCEETLVPILSDMFNGLVGIHALGVLHRDVKPDNFLYSRQPGIVKLCDFGISTYIVGRKSSASGVCGTAPFMSPEMLSDQGRYDMRTDVWSVGVIMYAIVCGEFPYMPQKHNSKAMKALVRSGMPAPTFKPMAMLESTDASACGLELMRRLLQRNPRVRPAAAEALQHPWFKPSSSSGHSRHSLQPSITMGKRAGAFSVPWDKRNGVDPILSILQAGDSMRGSHEFSSAEFCELCMRSPDEPSSSFESKPSMLSGSSGLYEKYTQL